MRIKKPDGFNEYTISLSYGEMVAIESALEANHAGAMADEMYAGLKYFIDRLPKPGEDPDDVKAAQDAEKEAKKAAISGETEKEADNRLPKPGDGEGAPEPEDLGGEDLEDEAPPSGEEELPAPPEI